MMKLHWSPRSPFVRKVMITLHETGLAEEVECVRSVVALQAAPNSAVLIDNPLGKIPVLITEEGKAVFDSPVICEYLDMKTRTGLFPADPVPRLNHLCWQALADGITDITLLWRTELLRESGPWKAVTAGWLTKVRCSMAQLESEARVLGETPFGIGHIAVAATLGQLDFRWPDCDWRDHFPNLTQLEKTLCERASIKATAIPDDQDGSAGDLTRGHLTFCSSRV